GTVVLRNPVPRAREAPVVAPHAATEAKRAVGAAARPVAEARVATGSTRRAKRVKSRQVPASPGLPVVGGVVEGRRGRAGLERARACQRRARARTRRLADLIRRPRPHCPRG